MKKVVVILLCAFFFLGHLSADNTRDCSLYVNMALRGKTTMERSSGVAALATCPSSGDIRRLLERAVDMDDVYVRRSAFESWRHHLDRDSLPFLLRLYHEPNTSKWEKVRLYSYMNSLAAGDLSVETGDLLQMVFRHGLVEDSESIRMDSLTGLGKLERVENWPYISRFLTELETPSLLGAALRGARLLKRSVASEKGIGFLSHRSPRVQSEAIDLVGSLSGLENLEALIRLDFFGCHGENGQQLLRVIREKMEREHPKLIIGITTGQGRLYTRPHTRSGIVSALARGSVLYIEKHTRRDFTLPPENRKTGVWYLASTRDGREGFIHESEMTIPLYVATGENVKK